MLQKARQHMLDNEQLTRQAARIHRPVKAIADAVDELRQTTLSAEQRGIVERLSAASGELTSVAEPLPRPPAKGRAAAR
jgi:multidrug resistance efflux pump